MYMYITVWMCFRIGTQAGQRVVKGKGSTRLLLVVGVGALLLLIRQLLRDLHTGLNKRGVVLELVVARIRELVFSSVTVTRLTLLTNSLALLTLLHTLLLVVHHTLTSGTSSARGVVEEAVLRGVGVSGSVLLRIALTRQRVLHVVLVFSASARVRLRISTTVVHVPVRTLLVGTRTAVRGIELRVGLSLVSNITLLVNELLHVVRIGTSVERVGPSSGVSAVALIRCNARLTSGGLLSGRGVLLIATSIGLSGCAGELRRIVEHLRVHQGHRVLEGEQSRELAGHHSRHGTFSGSRGLRLGSSLRGLSGGSNRSSGRQCGSLSDDGQG